MELLEIGIVGILASGLIQTIKNTFGTSSNKTKLVTVAVALLGGAVIYFFSGTEYWQSALGVLTTASAVYAFLIKK